MKLKRTARPIPSSVNSILMAAFLALLLFAVAVLSVTQYRLLLDSYSDQIVAEEVSLSREAARMVDEAGKSKNPSAFAVLNAYLTEKNQKTTFSVELIDSEGWLLSPVEDIEAEKSQPYAEQMEGIKERLKKRGGAKGEIVVYRDKGVHYAVTAIETESETVYLLVSTTSSLSARVRGLMISEILIVSVAVISISIFVLGQISSRISTPLQQISRSAKLMGKGNFDVKFDRGDGRCKEINDLAQSLEETREEISKSDRMQKELIANVSHDFKTPLTMIKAYASMIQDLSGDNPEKRNKHCQIIIDETDRLASLVGDLLDVSKISSGIDVLKPSVFNLSEFTLSVVERFHYLEDTKGYSFLTDITPDLYTEADKDKIGQVLYNLIGNAVNYTGEDKKIYIRLMRDKDCIRFDVRDTGKGIKKEELDTIWDRYYRSKEAHKRPVQGTGLGLSIVKAILTRHAFSFGVNSEYGKGSVFYVEFPPRTVRAIE